MRRMIVATIALTALAARTLYYRQKPQGATGVFLQ